VFTVIETPTFSRLSADYRSEEDRSAFIYFIAANPDAGDVVPGSSGVRENIPAHALRQIKEEIEND